MNEHENEVAEPRHRLEVKLEMQGAVDENCEAVVGDDVVAGAGVVNVCHEAVDRGCEVVDEANALARAAMSPSMSSVTSSRFAATSFSLISCPVAPPTSALSLKFSSSLALLPQALLPLERSGMFSRHFDNGRPRKHLG